MNNPNTPSNLAEAQEQLAGLDIKEEDAKNVDNNDEESVASDDSANSVMEPFVSYRIKIEQLLDSIGFKDFSIESIQHGYGFQNCVYALTSLKDPTEKLILRVALDGFIRDSDGRHETLENDIAVLSYLENRLPVPRIKAYSLATDNVLEAAYTIQTRIPGESLNQLWSTMAYTDKCAIVDEFLDLLYKLESVKFARAGTFVISASLPAKSNDFSHIEDPLIRVFQGWSKEPQYDWNKGDENTGSDIKSLLTKHLDSWIREEFERGQHDLSCSNTPRFKKLLEMIREMNDDGFFKDQPFPIVLHHWDLEPRNLMVSKASGAWEICGVIDWDDVIALPTPLSRVPPRWIWHFPDEDPDLEDGYLNDDQYADPELSDENKALKSYFDTKVEALIPGYTEDAYGRGRWMRRIWHFAKEGAFRTWQWDFLEQLPKDWEARPRSKPKPHNAALHWLRNAVKSARFAVFNKPANEA